MTRDNGLVSEFLNAYKNSVNFRSIQKGDRLAVIYDRKYRLGKPLKNQILKLRLWRLTKSRITFLDSIMGVITIKMARKF